MVGIIDALRRWFAACPILQDGLLNVEYLGSEAIEYTIDADAPANPVVKRYIDGDTLRQFPFVFASREEWGSDTAQNIAGSRFYEELSAWVERMSDAGELPELGAGRTAQYITVDTVGAPFSVTENTARYQIGFTLVYHQEG